VIARTGGAASQIANRPARRRESISAVLARRAPEAVFSAFAGARPRAAEARHVRGGGV